MPPTISNGQTYLSSTGQGKIPQWFGVYPAVVISNADPAGKGALQMQVPMVSGITTTTWAPPLAPYTTLPTPKTVVYASYIGGDVSKPVWMWNEEIVTGTGSSGSVTYAPVPPESPEVGAVWYPTSTVNGQQSVGDPEVWTFTPPSTFGWVTQGGVNGASIISNTVTGTQVANSSLTGSNIAAGSIGAGILGANAVTNYNIGANAISTTNIQPNSISTPLLQANSVTADIIESGIVVAGIVDSTEIDSATFRGPNFVINTHGIFFYTNPI
jgi:hypothetical protein